ncbi:MAG: FAD-binding oxidoreductase, partial [Anaerolineales bacterium]
MLDQEKKRALKALFRADQVLTNPAQTAAYQLDAGMKRRIPEAVVLPEDANQVASLARWASQHRIPLTSRGAGTSYTGGSITTGPGIVVSFARMKNILAVDETNRQAVVQPGVVNNVLQQHILPKDLVYPPDPASYSVCTLGGNIAENAGGPHCLKYGVTNNYVLGLEVVLASGETLSLGGRALDPPEYDLTSLLTGSEGTLALVTQATLMLRRPFEGVQALTASFSSMSKAGEAVSSVIAAGLMPATIELMDNGMINIVEDYLHAGFPRQAGAMLIIDVDGYAESLDIQLSQIAAIVDRYQPLEIKTSRTAQEREVLWRGRRSAAGAISRISPNELLVDVSVPRSRLAETIQEINAIGARHNFRVCYLAHAGDGNLHPNLLCDFSKPGEKERALRAAGDILQYCAGIGGSISGEHGIGLEKRDYMKTMYSPGEIDAMLEIKQVFDPRHLLNPGKIFPDHLSASVDGDDISFLPGSYFQPSDAQQAAEGLRALQQADIPTYIAAGQTHWQGDSPPGTRLSSAGLRGIQKVSPEDLYVTALSGTPLSELQAALEEKGFWIPVPVARAESTLGGALAANANGPLRSLYGGLRDQLLALEVILADGRRLRFGRPLVKDVAGYNVSKLLVGSYGTLGLITEVTLKLHPLPRIRRSLITKLPDIQHGLRCAYAALRQAIACSGIVLVSGQIEDEGANSLQMVYTAEGHPQDVSAELRNIHSTLVQCGAAASEETDQTSATRHWEQLFARSDCVVRAAVPSTDLPHLLVALPSPSQPFVMDVSSGMLALACPPANLGEMLSRLRLVAEPHGYTILAAGARSLLQQVDPWGEP